MRICTKLGVTTAFLFCVLNCVFAQTLTEYGFGILSGNTYVGQHENVNVGNWNMHIEIPLVKFPGRNRHDYSLSLQYNGQIGSGSEYFDYNHVEHVPCQQVTRKLNVNLRDALH